VTAPLSSPSEVAAFMTTRGALQRVEWRDADGLLVARPLAHTVTLSRGRYLSEVIITLPAGEALAILEDAA
jgi:hypothetical protein